MHFVIVESESPKSRDTQFVMGLTIIVVDERPRDKSFE
jgi:hypothetical protein